MRKYNLCLNISSFNFKALLPLHELKKAIVIHNPGSGTRSVKTIQAKVESALKDHFSLDYQITESFQHLKELVVPENLKRFDAVFVCGGDGTVNVVAKNLCQTNIPLGIVPTGSGNGLANSLELSSIDIALQKMVLQKTSTIDTLDINGHFSVNVSGIGFDAHIADLFSREKKRGFLKYLKLVIQEFKNKSYWVVIDTKKEHLNTDCLFVSIANSNQWGNNIKINPDSSLTDGTFEIICLEKIYYWHIPKLIYLLMKGRINQHSKVHIYAGNHAIIKARNAPLHIDGDYIGNVKDEVNVSIQTNNLMVYI